MNGGLPLLEDDIVAGAVALVVPTINAPPVSSVSVKNKKDTDDDGEDKNDTTSEYKDYQCDTTEEDSECDDEPTEFVSVQVFDVEGKSAVFQIPQSTDENEEEMEMEQKNNDEADANDADADDKEEERSAKRNDRTGLYRTTWSDLIHAADAYPKEECEEHIVSKDKEVKIEVMHITSFDGERGAVEESIADNISEMKKEHEQEKNECPQTYICEYTKDDEPATTRIVNLKKDQEKNDENQANNLVTSDSDRYDDESVPMITSVEQDQELEQEQSHNMNENEESPIVSSEVYEKEVVIDTDVSKIDTQKPEHKEEQIKEQNQVKNDENKNKNEKTDIDDVLNRLKDRTKSLATDEINEDEDDKDHIVDVLSDAYKKQEKEDGTQYEGGSAVLLTALESTDFVACATIDDTLATDSTLDEEDDKHVVDLLSVAYKKQHEAEVAQAAALNAAEIKSVAAAELAAEIGEKFETNKVTTKRVGLAIQEATSFSIDRVAMEVKQFITADLNDSNEEKVTKKEEIGEEKDEIKSRLNPAIDGLESAYKKQELYQEEERDEAIEDEQGVVSAGIENLSTTKNVDSVFNDTIHLSTKDEDTGETPVLDVLVDAKNNPQEEEHDNNKATMLTVAALTELVTHDTTTTDEMIKTALAANKGDKIDVDVEEEEEEKEKTKDTEEIETEKITTDTEMKKTKNQKYQSGIWLFTDRNNISHFFAPNFYPPYDTKEKRKIIFDVLKEEWDETSLSFKSYGQGSVMMEPVSAAITTPAEKTTINKDPEKEKKSKKEDITSPLKVVDDMINDAVSAFTNIACSVFNNKYIDCS